MGNVAWGSIRSLTEGDYLPRRDSAEGRALGTGKFAKVIVEGAVFFDDINDMLNLTQTTLLTLVPFLFLLSTVPVFLFCFPFLGGRRLLKENQGRSEN